MHHELTIQNYQRDALNIIYSSNIITLLYMFRVSSTHLQEDIVVHKQPYDTEYTWPLTFYRVTVPYAAYVQLCPPEDEYLILETVEESNNIWRINNIQCITLVVLYGQCGKLLHVTVQVLLSTHKNKLSYWQRCHRESQTVGCLWEVIDLFRLRIHWTAVRLCLVCARKFYIFIVSHVLRSCPHNSSWDCS